MAKRIFDIVASALGLVVLSPVFAAVSFFVLIELGCPILFRQTRVGSGGHAFQIFKFRTMTDERDAAGNLLLDETRATLFGSLLRRFRIDEIPELLQILTGSMSVVGPRPLPRNIAGTSHLARLRETVRPGLTGLAQISGNTELNLQEKLALDAWYVEHRSLALDLVIIFKTLVTVLRGERRDESLIRQAMSQYADDIDRCC